ncbi:PREDICTED: cytochrome P450 2M1-like [Priapulus caudatus]|uniref:Cytochrome P450 2M1-like n=1 Tax=Priapulus caudatus TaxID=37621 RepID=A0ABM1FBQ7_PRICU|nr:PREDICTED: cytochrome P450 2M1-like [Priapulus caudatus]
MMMVNLVTVVLGIIVFLLMLWWMTFPRNLPPGPRGLPILGYLPFLGKHPYLTLTELGKRYGPVFTVWLGPVPVIVLNSYDAIREAYVHRGADFMDRKCNFVQEHLFGCEVTKQGYFCHKLDQGLMDGLRIARHALGGAGIGRVPIEQQIREVLDNLIEEFVRHGKGKQAFNPRANLSAACSSISCAVLFSKRYTVDVSMAIVEEAICR